MSTGCAKLTYTDQSGQERAPVNVKSVVVFESENALRDSKRTFDVLGTASGEGSFFSSKGSMRKNIIKKAAEVGADAVVFVEIADFKSSLGTKEWTPTIGRTYSERPHGSKKRVMAYFLKFK